MEQQINLCKLIEEFGSEEKCREYMEALRWSKGVRCPRCIAKTVVSRIEKRAQYDCDKCRYQFSVTAGTIFNDSHLPLWKWFLATYLICESKKGMSANQIKRTLGVSYKTAWYLCHRIRAAMKEAEHLMTGKVEIDECYIGGKRKRKDMYSNKIPVIGIKERSGHLHLIRADAANQDTIYDIIAKNVDKHVDVIMTDESKLYNFKLTKYWRVNHQRVNHSAGEYVRGDITTNGIESAFSLLKRGVIGTWHRISAKHLPAYLDEMTWRFNNRKNPFLFRDTMLRLLDAKKLEYSELVA